MIDKATWNALVKEWEKVGKVYQIPRRVEYRLKFFCDHALKYLKSMNVVELGCNAGVYSIPISEVCHSYTGVEPGNLIAKPQFKTSYFAQAQMTEKHIGKHEVHFLNMTVEGYVKATKLCNKAMIVSGLVGDYPYALVMSYCLYHFSNKEVELLASDILPTMSTVIIQTRNQKRPKKHNSYKFWKSKNVVKFFMSQGFTSREIVWEKDRKFSLEMFFKPSLYNKEASCNAQSASQPVKDSSLNTTKNAQANGTAPSATSPTP